jgi:hypothetical protein
MRAHIKSELQETQLKETQLMCRGVSIYKFGSKVSLTDKEGDVFMTGNIEHGRIRLQCKIATPQNISACTFGV